MQQSYRWQPHLPFFPVNLPYEPWAERYNYTYHTLPIVEVGGNGWGLEIQLAKRWFSHVEFFSRVNLRWRNQLAYAPMTVDYLPDIREQDIFRRFESEEKARRYCWYYRTLVFSMFAEFSFAAAGKPRWKELLGDYCKEMNGVLDEKWLNDVEDALCDFRYTKRAGVIIHLPTTELWPFLRRYLDNGVPTLFEVGHVIFHDNDPIPGKPSIHIVDVTLPRYHSLPSDWPPHNLIFEKTAEELRWTFPDRDGSGTSFLPFPRPRVEELGGDVHCRGQTTPWVNPYTHETCDLIQVVEPVPANPRRARDHMGWVEFLDIRRESNRKRELNETPNDKQKRESRIRDSIRINKKHSSGPSNKSTVYEWIQEPIPEGEVSMRDFIGFIWNREKLTRNEALDVWDSYQPSQRLYDSFHNQWDLNRLFDLDADLVEGDLSDDDQDYSMDDATHIDKINMAYLDDLNVVPAGDAYTGVQLLASQIAFVAPKDLEDWALHCLGFTTPVSLVDPVSFPPTSAYIGFFISEADKTTTTFKWLQEFVFHLVKSDFDNPRLRELSDLHPRHRKPLDLSATGVYINRVEVSSDASGSASRMGFILTPNHKDSSYTHGWILVLFEAISVLHVLRNSWGSGSMEDLVRHLVRHGIQFRTLIPATQPLPDEILKQNEAPANFTTIPPADLNVPLTPEDYTRYVEIREDIIKSPHGRAAFRMGGIVWRLAMESQGNFDEVINEIMDGPSEYGVTRGEYMFIQGMRYYDLSVTTAVADTICGVHGLEIGDNKAAGGM